ncbi:flagellar motor switch protein [Heliomarina baculiformis]|uniref:flagellar motor switch protein n=1 Tax=Heliomarina baculiformis TaxID=2872036 RepID=UPI001EE2C169|nr:flagellar motor switch protein [Heliomarina baculiformis]
MSLLIDILILALLAGVLGYAYLVDRRVRNLVAVLRDLEPVVGQFSAAVDKSEDSVAAMKSVTESLQEQKAAAAAVPRQTETPSFHSIRPTAQKKPAGVASVTGKADMVRSFFDTVRSREA